MTSKTKSGIWYRLDNAAKIYPAINNAQWSSNFRISATLKKTVDPPALQRALDRVTARFPNFRLRLRRGFFWYYLDQNPNHAYIQEDVSNPCGKLGRKDEGGQLFRVRYFHCRIAVEVFHVVCDGTGLLSFLKTLVAEYLAETEGITVSKTEGVLDCSAPSPPEEMEDAFRRYASFRAMKDRRESRAFHYRGTLLPRQEIRIITGLLPRKTLAEKAASYGASITEFLVAVLIQCYADCQNEGNSRVELPVKISVPVNMRNFYPTRTLRNFSLFLNPGIEPKYGAYTLEEIIDEVHHFMRMNLKEKYLNAVLCKNLSTELNPFMRIVPLFLKNIGLVAGFRLFGESRFSSTFSNLGVVRVPKEMAPFIERFDFMLGTPRYNTGIVGGVCYHDTVSLTFTRSIEEPEIERRFFTALLRLGIRARIESNQG